MRPMGFSTGALAKSDFSSALSWISGTDSNALELSALRESEFYGLLDAIQTLDLSKFDYKSIHAPKSFEKLSEKDAVSALLPFVALGFRVVLHPDAISAFEEWERLGNALCIENMDTRKSVGRTPDELRDIFAKVPNARFCFDIGHARQVDPSMAIAMEFVAEFGDRIEQVHASEVDTLGNHWSMSQSCISAFAILAGYFKKNVAVILESQVAQAGVAHELHTARSLFK